MTKNPVMIAALAAAALAFGACGSSKDNGAGGAGQGDQDKAFASALKFAKCMRDEGVDMPDPQKGPGGGILQRMGNDQGQPVNEAKIQAAQKQCEKYMPTDGGDREGPGSDPEQRDALLAYSKCMRASGVPSFPDPKFSGNKVQLSIGTKDGSGTLNPDSPAFKAAEKKCQPLMAKLQGAGPSEAGKGKG